MRRIISLSIASVTALVAILLLTVIILTACNSSSDDKALLESKDGVQFSATSIEQVTAQSKSENKPVFLLAHASYCSSCKKMIRTVFPEKEIGDLFNKSFINAQVDIESEEGKRIVRDYKITGTPTLLFLASDGKIINKSSGFHSKEELIALTKGLSFEGKMVCE